MKGWQDIGSDVNWSDYGGNWAKKSASGVWFVVRFINMWDACGERDCQVNGTPRYLAEVVSVDLNEISEATQRQALECVGAENEGNLPELARVEACVSYGAHAPLDSFSGHSYPARVRANARRAAEALMADESALEAKLERPVNRIGSTAREYMQGDLDAALIRYQAGEGDSDPGRDIMLKMHGMPARVAS